MSLPTKSSFQILENKLQNKVESGILVKHNKITGKFWKNNYFVIYFWIIEVEEPSII